MKAIANMPNI